MLLDRRRDLYSLAQLAVHLDDHGHRVFAGQARVESWPTLLVHPGHVGVPALPQFRRDVRRHRCEQQEQRVVRLIEHERRRPALYTPVAMKEVHVLAHVGHRGVVRPPIEL